MKRSPSIVSLPAIAFGLLLSVGGCAVDQQAEVNTYRQVLDARWPDPGAYSEGQPLTLVTAMMLANKHNEQLGLRGEDYLQALIAKNRAVAAFLPTVSFQPSFTIEQRATGEASTSTGPGGTGIGQGGTGSGTGTANTGTVVGGGGFVNEGKISYRTEAPVVGNINLFRGGGDIANLRSAEANIDRQRLLLLDAQATVLLNVAQVYVQVLRSERAVQVLGNSLSVQEARLRDVQQQFDNQLATKLAVAQTQAQVNGTRAALLQAQSDVRNGRHTLALLVGVDRIDGPLSEPSIASKTSGRDAPEVYEQLAIASREDLAAARAAAASARAQVDAAFAQYYPSVSLNTAGFLYREFFSDASKWNAVLSANLPIFSAGIIHADVRTAWSRLRQAALYESYLRREVLNDVRTAYENLVTADRKIAEYEQQVQAASEALGQARAAFNNQLAINLDVLVSQDQQLNAELLLAGVRYDRAVFYLDLIRSAGSLPDIVAMEAAHSRPASTQAVSTVHVVTD